MDWAYHESQVRFDIRAEREECERLFKHPARVLQDRLARCGGSDRTRRPALPEWKKVFLNESLERRLLLQARVLSWGKEKRYYYSHKAPKELRRSPHDDPPTEELVREHGPLPNDVVESRTRIRSIVSRMKEAIADHDFAKARWCSDEERIERAKLRLLYQEHGLSGTLFD
jgi:hypothetical protein